MRIRSFRGDDITDDRSEGEKSGGGERTYRLPTFPTIPASSMPASHGEASMASDSFQYASPLSELSEHILCPICLYVFSG